MPTARRRRAAGAREDRGFADVRAVCVNTSGVTTKPHCAIACAAESAVVPIAAAGAFIAKYTAGSSTQAATSAIYRDEGFISMTP
jgi:hypothetical protein